MKQAERLRKKAAERSVCYLEQFDPNGLKSETVPAKHLRLKHRLGYCSLWKNFLLMGVSLFGGFYSEISVQKFLFSFFLFRFLYLGFSLLSSLLGHPSTRGTSSPFHSHSVSYGRCVGLTFYFLFWTFVSEILNHCLSADSVIRGLEHENPLLRPNC